MVDDDEWKYQRRLAKSLFSSESLELAVHITHKHLDTLIDRIKSSVGNSCLTKKGSCGIARSLPMLYIGYFC